MRGTATANGRVGSRQPAGPASLAGRGVLWYCETVVIWRGRDPMRAPKGIPPQLPGRLYSTEGGVETEIMYKWGYELPQFAMYPLFRDREAVEMVRGIYRRNYEVAVRHGMTITTGGFDYRASPD